MGSGSGRVLGVGATYLFRRLIRAVLTILAIITAVFALVRLVPGDPVDSILGDHAAPEEREALRARLKLDLPILEQYTTALGETFDGTLGRSFRTDRTVSSLIGEVIGATVRLGLAALALAWLLAVPLGILAARFRGQRIDRAASFVGVLGLAIPTIWLGPLLILGFGVQLRWAPLPGDGGDSLGALILPAITLGTALAASMMRQTRGALAAALGEPYALAARGRGLPERKIVRGSLRASARPVLTIAAAQIGALLSGTVVVEKIFERPGLGSLFLDAFFSRDIPVVQGCVLVIAVIYVLVNVALDVAYAVADPRVRVQAASA